MRYRVRHRNRYKYSQPVSLCHSHATLLPRDTLNQRVLGARMTIFPMIEDVHERQDLFGNRVSQFSIDEVHTELNVLAESEVEVRSNRIDLDRDIDWADSSAIPAKTRLFLRPSLYVSIRNQAIEQFAEQFFARTSKLLEATKALNEHIFHEFVYDRISAKLRLRWASFYRRDAAFVRTSLI